MDKSFSRKIVFFNFLYSLIVLAYHANANVHFSNIIFTGSLWDNIAYKIDLLFSVSDGTYFFMLLSAFLLYRDLSENNIKQKILKRVRTLLIPWLLWNIIGMISYHDFDKGIAYLVSNFLTSRFCEQLWFVEALMILLLFSPLFIRIFKIKILREILLVALFVLGYMGFPFLQELHIFPSGRLQLEILRALRHVPVYCLGVYLGLNFSEAIIAEEYNKKYRKISLIIAFVILVLPYIIYIAPVNYVFGMLKSVALWIILDKKFFVFEPKWWMQISFYTYAIHNFVLHWEGKIIEISGVFAEAFTSSTVSITFALGWRLVLSVCAFVLITISAKILIKCTPKFYEMLSGGRLPKMYS